MKKLYVFDLDGTLADLNHRLHFIKDGKKDWDSFFKACYEDKPIQWTIELLNKLQDTDSAILILSGRSGSVYMKTVEWLERYKVNYSFIRMRKEGDRRPDHIVKLEMLHEFLNERLCSVQFIVDDRQSVVDMWRANGFNVLQCNKWEE